MKYYLLIEYVVGLVLFVPNDLAQAAQGRIPEGL